MALGDRDWHVSADIIEFGAEAKELGLKYRLRLNPGKNTNSLHSDSDVIVDSLDELPNGEVRADWYLLECNSPVWIELHVVKGENNDFVKFLQQEIVYQPELNY